MIKESHRLAFSRRPRPAARASLAAVAIACALTACGGSTNSGGAITSLAPSGTAVSSRPIARVLPDNLCTAIDSSTIDSVLKVKVSTGIWDGTHNCTWVSTQPAGGLTLSRLTETQGAPFFTGGTPIAGLGIRAVGGGIRTGQPSPLPASSAQVVIDLGDRVLSVHVSGPAVSIDDAVKIAHDVLG